MNTRTESALIAAALNLAGETKSSAAVLPIPNTTPELVVCYGERAELLQLLVCPQCSGPHTLDDCPRWRYEAGSEKPLEAGERCELTKDETRRIYSEWQHLGETPHGLYVRFQKAVADHIPAASAPEGAPADASESLVRIGAAMANVMFNLAQQEGFELTAEYCAGMDKLRKEWDEARRAAPSQSADQVRDAKDPMMQLMEINQHFKAQGWRDMFDCPVDIEVEFMEFGSTGIHKGVRLESGDVFLAPDGEFSMPILWRPLATSSAAKGESA